MTVRPEQHGTQLSDANDCLKNSKSLGEETVDGTACEKHQYKDCGGKNDTTVTLWIAKGKQFAKKMEMQSPQGSSTILYKLVETDAKVSDSEFTPPANVVFKDMAEMMKGMQPPPGGKK